MQLSPVALFVYNRPFHLQRVVQALRNNFLAKESQLFIFSDAPEDVLNEKNVAKVRRYIKSIEGFKKVTVIERNRNFGLSGSIISGVTELIAGYGKVIVLEDDLVTSPYFLQFMNDSLRAYQNNEEVISVCGYMYPLKGEYAQTLLLRIADCWGWATWKRGWDLFVPDGAWLYSALKDKGLFKKFNLENAVNYAKMLKGQIQGRNDSWAVRWYACALLQKKLSLYPRKTLVMNIGLDGSGRHGGSYDYFKAELLNEQVNVDKIRLLEDERAIKEIIWYLKKQRFNLCRKAVSFLRKQCNRATKSGRN